MRAKIPTSATRRSVKSTDVSPLSGERGTIYKEAGCTVGLGYPAPYRVGVSSLGAQMVYRMFNEVPGLGCARFFLPESGPLPRPLVALESRRPAGALDALAFSIACEQELLGLVQMLEAADLAPLAKDRSPGDPPVIIGGPLTMVDPRLVAPLADVVALGEADHLIQPLGEALISADGVTAGFLEALAKRCPELWLPGQSAQIPVCVPRDDLKPAYAATWSPQAELKNLFLVEASRGCGRRCAFCTMSRLSQGAPPHRVFSKSDILAAVPRDAEGVGLVGAAVSEHPDIVDIVGELVAAGHRVSLSSIRADCLTEALAGLLKQGGLRALTVAADGPSERLRRSVHKGIAEKHLRRAAEIARSAGFSMLKVYAMVGLPGEEDEDIFELADLLVELARGLRVSASLQTFVPKPGTPLADAPMVDTAVASRRLGLLERRVKGRIRVLPTSPKWSWVDWRLAHAGFEAAAIAISANRAGGGFAAWKRAIEETLGAG